MKIRLGFACICESLGKQGRFRTIQLKTANKILLEQGETELHRKLKEIAIDNLYNTLLILKFCDEYNIRLYRLSSDLIPLATHDINTWDWKQDKDVINICNRIKEFAITKDIKLSFHPDQFVVINSFNENVFKSSVINLEYHRILSNMVGNKVLVLHVGGVYGDKSKATDNFIKNFNMLPSSIQNLIHLENDDKSYNVKDVLEICETIKRPMILDLHHYRCLPCGEIDDYMDRIINTWKDEMPKIHLSSGKDNFTDKKHAEYIAKEDYEWALDITKNEFNIMLECKKKDLALFELLK